MMKVTADKYAMIQEKRKEQEKQERSSKQQQQQQQWNRQRKKLHGLYHKATGVYRQERSIQ
jgi:hypothetical protein